MSAPPAHAALLAIPVHDEGARLAAFAAELAALGPGSGAPPVRLVVVDDGSGPAAAARQAEAVAAGARALAAAGSAHALELVTAPRNLGKGAAIRLAWAGARGEPWLGFVDGDGAVPAAEVWRLAARLAGAPAFDVLAASRLGGGRAVRRAPLRELQGRAFSVLAEAVLGLGLSDPQCGLKLFRAARLAPRLGGLREGRWLLDLELLIELAQDGARFEEVAIDWHESGRSTVVAGIDPVRMAWGLLRLRWRLGRARR